MHSILIAVFFQAYKMSLHNNKSKTNRQLSIKLCQLIVDRQIPEEISNEIMEVLQQGADINFCDANRDNNTPLHLAIEREDFGCVKYLHGFKPNILLKNDEGNTPLDLARKVRNIEILNFLTEVRSETKITINDSIDADYIMNLDFEKCFEQDCVKQNRDKPVKIVKITNCKNMEECVQKIQTENTSTWFSQMTHLFLIVFEVKDKISNLKSLSLINSIFDDKRPWIIQISSMKGDLVILYKEASSKYFTTVDRSSIITVETFMSKLLDNKQCNFDLLFQAMNSKVFGHFTGSLLDVEFCDDEISDEIISYCAARDVLCVRFLQLFKQRQQKPHKRSSTLAAINFEGEQSLLALYDLPFVIDREKIYKNKYENIHEDLDKHNNNKNLLTIAIERYNSEAVRLLLKLYQFDIDSAVSTADNLKRYDCLAELLQSDSCFPHNFNVFYDPSKSEFERLHAVIAEKQLFHDAITSGSLEAVKMYIVNNPHVKYSYDMRNRSALSIALEAKQFQIYSFMRSNGFSPGIDISMQELFEKLSDNQKREIRDANKQYFDTSENSAIFYLISKTRLGFNVSDRMSCFQKISELYGELSQIKEVHSILRAVENSDELDIVFDPNLTHVSDLDPTASVSIKLLTNWL